MIFQVEITDLMGEVLATVSQREDTGVPIPLNDGRTASVRIPISHAAAAEVKPLTRMLRVWYRPDDNDDPDFWGVIADPDWHFQDGYVDVTAVDAGFRLNRAFARFGDAVVGASSDKHPPNSPTDYRTIRFLILAAENTAAQAAAGDPDIGIKRTGTGTSNDASEADSGYTMQVERGSNVAQKIQEIIKGPFGPDVELYPMEGLGDTPSGTPYYVALRTHDLQGQNRATAVIAQPFAAVGGNPAALGVDADYVYWWDASTNSIGRVTKDGSTIEPDFITDVPSVVQFAINETHLFWADGFTGSIARANIDGSGLNLSFILLGGGGGAPTGIALNSTKVYWTDNNNSSVGRANLDGTGVNENLVTGITLPAAVALDAAKVYWAANGDDAIGCAALDGSGADYAFIPASDPAAVKVDATNVYWAEFSSHQIFRAALDGTVDPDFGIGAALVPSGTSPDEFVLTRSKILWVNFNTGIGVSSYDGSDADDAAVAAEWAYSMVTDGSTAYWANADSGSGDGSIGSYRFESLTFRCVQPEDSSNPNNVQDANWNPQGSQVRNHHTSVVQGDATHPGIRVQASHPGSFHEIGPHSGWDNPAGTNTKEISVPALEGHAGSVVERYAHAPNFITLTAKVEPSVGTNPWPQYRRDFDLGDRVLVYVKKDNMDFDAIFGGPLEMRIMKVTPTQVDSADNCRVDIEVSPHNALIDDIVTASDD